MWQDRGFHRYADSEFAITDLCEGSVRGYGPTKAFDVRNVTGIMYINGWTRR